MEGSFEHGNEPSFSKNVWKFFSRCTTSSFPRRTQVRWVQVSEQWPPYLNREEHGVRDHLREHGTAMIREHSFRWLYCWRPFGRVRDGFSHRDLIVIPYSTTKESTEVILTACNGMQGKLTRTPTLFYSEDVAKPWREARLYSLRFS